MVNQYPRLRSSALTCVKMPTAGEANIEFTDVATSGATTLHIESG